MSFIIKKIFSVNNAWAIFGQGSKVVFQVIFLMGLAIILEPNLYGKLAVIIATTLILSPFSGLGYGNLLIKQIKTENDKYPDRFNEMLFVLFISGFSLSLISTPIIYLSVDANSLFYLAAYLYAFTELILIKFNEIIAQIYLAKNRIKESSKIYFEISFLRALSVLIFYFITLLFNDRLELIDWVLIYFLIILFITLKNLYNINKSDPVKWEFRIPQMMSLKEGMYFSISMSSQGIYNEVDKNVLSYNHGSITTGHYTFAYRILDLFFFPLRTLYLLTYPNFFKVGYSKKRNEIVKYTNKVALVSIIYGATSLLLIYFGVEIFKRIELLNPYKESFYVIYFLAPIIFLRSIHYVFADSITGMGFQRTRSIVQIAIAIINFILCIIFIPQYSWLAAAIISLFSDTLLVVLILILYKKALKRMKD